MTCISSVQLRPFESTPKCRTGCNAPAEVGGLCFHCNELREEKAMLWGDNPAAPLEAE